MAAGRRVASIHAFVATRNNHARGLLGIAASRDIAAKPRVSSRQKRYRSGRKGPNDSRKRCQDCWVAATSVGSVGFIPARTSERGARIRGRCGVLRCRGAWCEDCVAARVGWSPAQVAWSGAAAVVLGWLRHRAAMIERLIVRNFKQFTEVEIELGPVAVFVGPNNAGKSSALQALALWELGVRRWFEKRGTNPPKKRAGVTINRRDLVSIPVPDTNLLWRALHVRDTRKENGKQRTENVCIEVEVHGIDHGKQWRCALEFDYANQESLYVRPLAWAEAKSGEDPVPEPARSVRVAYLPPMSGLTANELKLDRGAVQVRLGEGRTAEVLRNLCYELSAGENAKGWRYCVEQVRALFGVELEDPMYVVERGELALTYRDRSGVRLDITAAGRGLQQTLLLLTFLMSNPGSVLLLDEPDAHLEILRQEQIYQLLTTTAQEQNCQIVAASHSEVILQAAGDRDVVIAFVGKPHRIDDRGSQVLKALKTIRFDDYYLAERRGFVLYLEGSTDLAILRAFAKTMQHPAAAALEQPFVHEIGNVPSKALDHFGGLCEAKQDLVGFVLVDRREGSQPQRIPPALAFHEWSRREIENYLCFPEVLDAYARGLAKDQGMELFGHTFTDAMRRCVEGRVPPKALGDRSDPFWLQVRASGDFMDLVFDEFFRAVRLPNLMRKTDYHRLAALVPAASIDPEVVAVLDRIASVAGRAKPVGS
ncbi:MAG: AAA family ATPase [Planctomycetota bacterium]